MVLVKRAFCAFTAFVTAMFCAFSFQPEVYCTDYQNAETRSFADRICELVNEARSELGLSPLYMTPVLCDIANTRAQEISVVFSHNRPDGSSCFSLVQNDPSINWYKLAENIAAGNSTPESTFNQWKNSSGHWKNITNPELTHIGIGVYYAPDSQYGWYWTQTFIASDQTFNGQYLPESSPVVTTAPIETSPPEQPTEPYIPPATDPPVTQPEVTEPQTEPYSETTSSETTTSEEITTSETTTTVTVTENISVVTYIPDNGYQDDDMKAYAENLCELINNAREKAGIPKLYMAPVLCDIANVRARETLVKFDHYRPDGSKCFTVFDEYPEIVMRSATENIARGSSTPEKLFQKLKDTSAVTDQELTHIGVGVYYAPDTDYGWYWAIIMIESFQEYEGQYFPQFDQSPVPKCSGDLNGDAKINGYDYILLLRYYFAGYEFSPQQIKSADLFKDDLITISDLVVLNRYILGRYKTLPITLDML